MNAATSIHAPNRIAAGVTAAYLLDLTRRPAPTPEDGRRGAVRGHRIAAVRVSRDRGDGGQRRAIRTTWRAR